MKKRIIPLFVVLALLLSVSVSAADLTEQGSDQTEVSDLVFEEGSVVSTEILPVTDGEYSVAPLAEDYGVAIASDTSEADWLSYIYSVLYQPQSSDGVSYSIYGLLMQVWYNALESNTWLNNINQNITAGTTLLDSMSGYLRTLVLDNHISSGVGILWADGTDKTLTSEQSFLNVVRHGLRGVGVLLNTNNDLLSENNSLLDEGNTTFASFVDLFQRLNILDAGVTILWGDGTEQASSGEQSFLNIVRHGFRGVGSLMRALNSSVITVDNSLHDLISGSETDNTYSGSITSNDNVEAGFSAVGLGPLLNTWLGAIEQNLGQLAYMYADDEQLAQKVQEKEEAEQAKNEIAEKTEQMDTLVEDMNSVNKPDVNSVVPDVNIVVSDNDISVISDSLAPWFQQSLFLNYLLIVCMLMFVSYVLFGKKG